MPKNGYHLTEAGPKECNATVEPCPKKGSLHFDNFDDALAVFESQGSFSGDERRSYTVGVTSLAGGRYYGCEVTQEAIEPCLEEWKSIVGAERAESMSKQKAARDRGYKYHMTVIRPNEASSIPAEMIPPDPATLRFVGVGTAKKGDKEAWFLVVRCPRLARWRESNGLPPHDFHITLGFDKGDVHGVPKDSSTIVNNK